MTDQPSPFARRRSTEESSTACLRVFERLSFEQNVRVAHYKAARIGAEMTPVDNPVDIGLFELQVGLTSRSTVTLAAEIRSLH